MDKQLAIPARNCRKGVFDAQPSMAAIPTGRLTASKFAVLQIFEQTFKHRDVFEELQGSIHACLLQKLPCANGRAGIPNKHSGFSLIEVLIALAIFAIIAVISAGILHTVFNANDASHVHTTELERMQLSSVLLRKDIVQMVNRPVRAANSTRIAALIATAKELEFTRTGVSNPFGAAQHSSLQRVRYRIKNGELIRSSWPRLDRTNATTPQQRVLLKHIISGGFSYLGQDKTFYEAWPPGNLIRLDWRQEILPRAVAIHLNVKNQGDFYLLIPVPASQLSALTIRNPTPP